MKKYNKIVRGKLKGFAILTENQVNTLNEQSRNSGVVYSEVIEVEVKEPTKEVIEVEVKEIIEVAVKEPTEVVVKDAVNKAVKKPKKATKKKTKKKAKKKG